MIDPYNRPVLGSGRLRLRAPTVRDIDARLALGAHADIQKMFGYVAEAPSPYTRAMAEDWVEAQMSQPHAFVIERDGTLLGSVRLHSLNVQDKRANLAIGLLHPDFLGQGIGTEVMRLLLAYGFGDLALNRIALRVIEYNQRAIAAYGKLGFVIEGRERQAALVGRDYHDDIIMGLLASEWHP